VLHRPLTLGEQQAGFLAGFGQFADRFGRAALATVIAGSDEARTWQINRLYQEILKRNAEPGGLAVWLAAMRGGVTYEQIKVGMISSPGYTARFGGDVAAILRGMYLDALGRAIDATGEALFLPALQGGALTVGQVATAIVYSAESRGLQVEAFYQDHLKRSADAVGKPFWAGQLLAGAPDDAVLALILASAEYFNREVL
jgi:hypothetical protein